MKTRHKLTLTNYLNYGEGYSSSINYDEKSLKLVNYGRQLTTRPTERNKVKQQQQHNLNKLLLKLSKAKLALVGDSIVSGLHMYPVVWNELFTPLGAINLGIGGDKVENILWRIEDTNLPPTLQYFFVYCGTNNIGSSSPKDIADGILSIGIMAKKQQEQLKIVIGGLLPCDKEMATRSIINKVNKVLRQKICKLQDFYFMEGFDWTNNDDLLNMELYYQDRIHLNHKGNEKFGNTIIRKFKHIESLSRSCSSAGIILRMSSVEAPQNAASRVSPVLSTVSSPPVCHSSQSSSRRNVSSPRPLFTEVPKSVYDHHKQLLNLSSHRPLYHLSLRSRQRRSSSLHCSSLKSKPSSHLSSLCDERIDDSCEASPSSSPCWSFWSFIITVLSGISLPVTTFSSHFALFLLSLSCHLSFSLHPLHSQSRSSHDHSSQSRCIPSLSLSQRSPNSHSFQSPSHSNKFISMLLLFIFTFYFVCLLSHTSMTADLTDCESSLSNNSLSFNCSNRSSLIYCDNACIFLPDRYSFLMTTSYSV